MSDKLNGLEALADQMVAILWDLEATGLNLSELDRIRMILDRLQWAQAGLLEHTPAFSSFQEDSPVLADYIDKEWEAIRGFSQQL